MLAESPTFPAAAPIFGHPGVLVPDQFVGRVAGQHTMVHNIEVREHPGGTDREQRFFISLVTDPDDQTALSIRVPEDHDYALDQLREGVVITGNAAGVWLREDGHSGDREILRYDDDTPRYQGTLNVTPSEAARILETPLATVREILLHRPDYRRGLAPLLDAHRAEAPEAEAPAREGDDPFTARARHLCRTGDYGRLVGLGPGFTPAGDDFLTGLLVRAHLEDRCGSLPPRKRSRFDLLRREIYAGLHRTTTGGATLLRLALDNRPPVYIHRICVILMDSETSVRSRVERALALAATHGHSSGLDFLTGLLWVLAERDEHPASPV